MKLLLITDSLGLPRPIPEVVKYNETWCHILSRRYDVHQMSFGGGSVTQLASQLTYLKMFEPDVVIVQSGIVDCAPRTMSVNMKIILNSNILFRKLSKVLVPKFKNYLRNKGRTYTSENDFEKQIKKFKDFFGDKLIWIGIAPSCSHYESKVPGVTKKIELYNEILRSNLRESNFLDISDFNLSYLMSDFIHLNESGHKELARLLQNRLNLSNK